MEPKIIHVWRFRGAEMFPHDGICGHDRFPIGTGVGPRVPHWDDFGGHVSQLWGLRAYGSPRAHPTKSHSEHKPRTINPTTPHPESRPPRPALPTTTCNQGRTLRGGLPKGCIILGPSGVCSGSTERLGSDQVYRVRIRTWALHGCPKLKVDSPNTSHRKGLGRIKDVVLGFEFGHYTADPN